MNDRHIEPGLAGPLGQAAERLLECLAAAGVTARLGATDGEGVSVVPIAVVAEALPGKGDQPLRMRLRCLVCAGTRPHSPAS